jgi:hypothetical protein
MANDTAEFVSGKPHIDCHGNIMEPELGFFIALANMDVRRLIAFVGIEEGSIGTPA